MYYFLILIFSINIFASIEPEKGLYFCVEGNEPSICDQQIKPFYNQKKLTQIKVAYVGECGYMGPYTYSCHENICEDAGLKFIFHDSKHYYWENKQYNFHCDFQKK